MNAGAYAPTRRQARRPCKPRQRMVTVQKTMKLTIGAAIYHFRLLTGMQSAKGSRDEDSMLLTSKNPVHEETAARVRVGIAIEMVDLPVNEKRDHCCQRDRDLTSKCQRPIIKEDGRERTQTGLFAEQYDHHKDNSRTQSRRLTKRWSR